MWVACNRARFIATRPRAFCELKIMKIVISIYQIIQEKFAYGELFMLEMIGYIFIIKMVKKMQNSGLEIVAGLTPPLKSFILMLLLLLLPVVLSVSCPDFASTLGIILLFCIYVKK